MIAIRFDGPLGSVRGRFIEVERDGASISFGEWKQDGDDCLLELPEVDRLEQAVRELAEILATVEHLKKWARPLMSLNARQVQDAVIRICDDALSELSDETKQVLESLNAKKD